MKIKREDYPYQEKAYEGVSFDLVDYVPAQYTRSVNKKYHGYSNIEALPQPRSMRELIALYDVPLPYTQADINRMSLDEKIAHVQDLRQMRVPMDFNADLERQFYELAVESYFSRYQLCDPETPILTRFQGSQEQIYSVTVAEDKSAVVKGLSLLGRAGTGKTTAIDMMTSHFPQVIRHEQAEGGWRTQIVYLVVNCPGGGSFGELYNALAKAVDKALGLTDGYYTTQVLKKPSLEYKQHLILRLIECFSIGVIILDEIQNLEYSTTKQNTYRRLLTLQNTTKVGLLVVGTEEAKEKIFGHEDMARRVGVEINAGRYCQNRDIFYMHLKRFLCFQFFGGNVRFPLTDEIKEYLYMITQGVIDHLVTIYIHINLDYLMCLRNDPDHVPPLDFDFVKETVVLHYGSLVSLITKGPHTEAEEKEIETLYAKGRAELDVTDTSASQEEASNMILQYMSSDEVSARQDMLTDVIRRINDITDYTPDQITAAFEKVSNYKRHRGKNADELAKATLDYLSKAKVPKTARRSTPVSVSEVSMSLTKAITNAGDIAGDIN